MIGFISNNASVLLVIGYFGTIVMLGLVAALLVKNLGRKPEFVIDVDMTSQIEQLRAAAQHHVEVSSVVAMVRQLEELEPDAIELLRSYPQSVRAAAMLHYTSALGSDLRAAHTQLSRMHQNGPVWQKEQAAAQAHVDALQAKLDAAVARSETVMV